jgi:multiple sugar transport system substrate-binding protein
MFSQTSRSPLNRQITRRSVLAGGATLLGALALPGLAACGSGGSGGNTVTFGSSDEPGTEQQGHNLVWSAAKTAIGVSVTTNSVDHNTFQAQIDNYLQATPQDFFSWGAGYRMRDLARRGLVDNVDDAWKAMGSQYSASAKALVTGDDGHQYYIPFDVNPWVVYYRKSVWAKYGYQIPTTWDAFIALANQMKKDGLTPIAFSDKDGWPALAWYDYLDMRMNGYAFHMSLMLGNESWTDPKVAAVFDTWRSVLPLCEQGPLGLTWEQSAQTMLQKTAGMTLQSGFLVEEFPAGPDLDDLDAFAFPEVDSAIGATAIEAPFEGFMVAKRGIPKNGDAVQKLMTYLLRPEPQEAYSNLNQPKTPVNLHASTAKYTPLQKKLASLYGSAKDVSQYLDDDANPTFAQTVMYPAIQQFIGNPASISSILSSVEKQKTIIYAQS